MAQSQMLMCANNYKNDFDHIMCPKYECVDDESHRINYCEMWKGTNLFDSEEKVNFDDVLSNEIGRVTHIVNIILENWNLENGKNEMVDSSGLSV